MQELTQVSDFAIAIKEEAEKQRSQIEKETKAFIASELEKVENEALLESYNYIKRSSENIRADLGRELSAHRLEQSRSVISRRDEICNEVFDNVKTRILEFCCTADYEKLLARSAEKIKSRLSGDGLHVFISERDKNKTDFVKSLFSGCTVSIDNRILLGGLKAEDKDGKLLADDTLDQRLEEQRELFAKNSGFVIE